MSTATGQLAETQAAGYLEERGFTILARNYRTRWSELDIVAEKNGRVHFVEVKFRARFDHGDGLDYITADKRQRLIRAAQAWVNVHEFDGPSQIDVIAVTGQTGGIDYLPNAIDG